MNELRLIKLIKRARKLLDRYENIDLDDEQKQKLHLQLQEIRETLKNSQNKRQEYLIRSGKNLENFAGVEHSLQKEINELILRIK